MTSTPPQPAPPDHLEETVAGWEGVTPDERLVIEGDFEVASRLGEMFGAPSGY